MEKPELICSNYKGDYNSFVCLGGMCDGDSHSVACQDFNGLTFQRMDRLQLVRLYGKDRVEWAEDFLEENDPRDYQDRHYPQLMEMEFIPLPDMTNYPHGWSGRLMEALIWGPEGEAAAFERFVSRKNV